MMRPRLLAHRGLHDVHPENTLGAFAAAADAGVDGIETDVRRTADGQLVLWHDRHAPDGAPVTSRSRSELTALAGRDVPLLAEALDAWPELWWAIELKDRGLAGEVVSMLRARPALDAIVISFWHREIAAVIEEGERRVGCTFCHQPWTAPPTPRPDSGPPPVLIFEYEFLDDASIELLRRAGHDLMVYGVDSIEEHERAAHAGLVGVITDWPDRYPRAGS